MSSSISMWILFGVSMFLAFIAERKSAFRISENGGKEYVIKEKFFFFLMSILLCLFVGLRIWCNDTVTYREIYEHLTPGDGNIFSGLSWKIGDSPAFMIFNRILKHLGASTQTFLMVYSIITNSLYLWFIRKYTSNLTMSVFLFWTMGVYLFSAAGMRQAIAIAIGLLGIHCCLQRRWGAFIIWILLAMLFHPYAILFIIAPFMMYGTWTKKTWIIMMVFGGIGIGLNSFMSMIFQVTEFLGKTYEVDSFSGEGVNIFRLLVVWAPLAVSFLARKFMMNSKDKTNNLFMNFSILNGTIMFIALFGTANYFARLANYFLIFQTLSLPWMIKFFNVKSQKILKISIVGGYLLYFIFAYVILTPFNSYFAKMSLIDYVRSLF